jgi:hypothetical protein
MAGENPRQTSSRISTEFERERQDSRLSKMWGVYRFRVPPSRNSRDGRWEVGNGIKIIL